MAEAMQWLKERAPGFAQLSDGERDAIVEFAFLWSLFESLVLDTAGSAARICAAVDTWREAHAGHRILHPSRNTKSGMNIKQMHLSRAAKLS